MNVRTIILGLIIVVIAFVGATLLMDVLWPVAPASLQQDRPALVSMPPLQPLAGTSTVLAPAAIAITAIGDALEAQAPRNLSGKPANPVSKILSNVQLNFNITRGPLSVTGRPDALVINTPLSGTFEALGTVTGGLGSATNALGGALGNIIGGNVGQQVEVARRQGV